MWGAFAYGIFYLKSDYAMTAKEAAEKQAQNKK